MLEFPCCVRLYLSPSCLLRICSCGMLFLTLLESGGNGVGDQEDHMNAPANQEDGDEGCREQVEARTDVVGCGSD